MDVAEELTKTYYEPDDMVLKQALNVAGFAIAMILNGISASMSTTFGKTLPQITVEYPLHIDPSTWAFSIWGLIYSLLALFVIYQALPSDWVPDRNNELIFDKIGYLFFINMLLNSVWIGIFQTGESWGFILAQIDIIAMVVTAVMFMEETNSNAVNWFEWISMRAGFGIYAGWVTGATILNSAIVQKSLGLQTTYASWGLSEDTVSIIVLWVAFLIYTARAFIHNNPMFGSVFIYTTLSIYLNPSNAAYTSVLNNTLAVMIALSVEMIGLWGYLGAINIWDIDTGATQGIFYKFKDLDTFLEILGWFGAAKEIHNAANPGDQLI